MPLQHSLLFLACCNCTSKVPAEICGGNSRYSMYIEMNMGGMNNIQYIYVRLHYPGPRRWPHMYSVVVWLVDRELGPLARIVGTTSTRSSGWVLYRYVRQLHLQNELPCSIMQRSQWLHGLVTMNPPACAVEVSING